jgi:hypothetical protein
MMLGGCFSQTMFLPLPVRETASTTIYLNKFVVDAVEKLGTKGKSQPVQETIWTF